MIIDKNNALHNALVNNVFDVPQNTARRCQLDFDSSSKISVNKAKAVIYHILSVLEGMSLDNYELSILNKLFLSAINAEIGHGADSVTIVSNDRISRIEALRSSKTYSGIIVTTETLSNSEYYTRHREEFAEMQRAQN